MLSPDLDSDRSLWLRSKSLLASHHKSVAIFISHLLSGFENQERLAAESLYAYCLSRFPGCLSVKLCEAFLFSEYDLQIRSESIMLLDNLLVHLNQNFVLLSPIIIHELKPLLISCLCLQETPESSFKILSKAVSDIAVYVFTSDDDRWDELQDYIVNTIDSDIRKVFILYHDLPLILDNEFLICILEKFFPIIVDRLDQDHADFDNNDWDLAFKAGFSFAVHMAESPRSDLSYNILYAMIRSAMEMVKEGLEGLLRRILEDLAEVVEHDAEKYSRRENEFVSRLVSMIGEIQGIEEDTRTVAMRIYQTLKEGVFLCKV